MSDAVTPYYLKIQEAASEPKPFSPVLRQLHIICGWHGPCQSDDLMANGAVLLYTGNDAHDMACEH